LNLEKINILTWTILFLLYLLIDVLNIRYLLCVQKLKPLSGAGYSLVLCILTSIGTVCFVENILNVIPIAFGFFFGTYITLLYEIRKSKWKT
jgi:hypothetical protein